MPTRTHGMGVRTDYPTTPRAPTHDVAPKPKPATKSAALSTYEAASAKGKLVDVSAAKAKSLETKFKADGAKVEDLSGGRVGASIKGLVVDGELFVRTAVVRPGATPKWVSAGALKEPKTNDTASPGWGPKPPKKQNLEALVQKTVKDRMGLLSNPDFALKGKELATVKKAIANGDFQVVSATPKGLAGVGMTGYVADGMLIVEKRTVRPGAPSTFYLMGPLAE